jgi:ATP-dependent DNA helicase RecQ
LNLQSILLKYWGFPNFRPLQEEIILSVLDGNDTLALLPTGGGKSLCYQVPGMARDGLCIVVTPLVALMKDQVQALRNKGIKAVGVYHGLSRMEMDVAIDNCIYGDTKFLYLSPERLTTELLRTRLPKMKVNLLAVDEAHCISQWGYDFRPPYLRIAEIRELIPNTPVLALTATATSQVVQDIQGKLEFRNGQVFQKSFERRNLAYVVFDEEDKLKRLTKICNNVKGVGIVYVRNRRKTREIADFLRKQRISADFYHAGLTTLERDLKQNNWMKERNRVIISTNAFGMGIDKPNVRFVVHLDLPDSPEAYFQEAGRAGRDGNKSFAVLLYNHSDIIDLERFHKLSYPPLDTIKKVYNCLGNYFQLAIGSGKDQTFAFDMQEFAANYSLEAITVFNTLKFLEKEGYLAMSDAMANPSRMMILLNNEELYRFQVANPAFDALIKVVLRSYSGLFSEFVKVNEKDIARRSGIAEEQVVKAFEKLHRMSVVHYEKQNQKAAITLLEERLAPADIRISPENYRDREKFSRSRMEAMVHYVETKNKCRSLLLLEYFGEQSTQRCGHCDVCLERNKAGVSNYEFDQVMERIKPLLMQNPMSLDELIDNTQSGIPDDRVLRVIQWLRDNGKVVSDSNGNLRWNTIEKKPFSS